MVESKNPVKIELIKKNEYQISIAMDRWTISQHISDKALNDLRSLIDDALGLNKISEVFSCTGEEAHKIKEFWDSRKNWSLCNKCNFKWKECYNCVVKSDSPLERDLLLEIRKNDIETVQQLRINKDGSTYDFPDEIDFDKILTIPDFFINNEKTKLCVYADGHTYHERTEEQALRDRNIDRELQKLGYKVLRYTGKEIRNDCALVVENIKSNLD